MQWLRYLYNELATNIGIDLCLSVWKNSLPLSLETSVTSVLVSTTLDTRHLFSQQLSDLSCDTQQLVSCFVFFIYVFDIKVTSSLKLLLKWPQNQTHQCHAQK